MRNREINFRIGNAKFDLIVIGAGTAGCVLAKTVAKAGFDVCLIDRKIASEVGNKVCGDAIESEFLDFLKIPNPSGEELKQKIEAEEMFSPDKKAVFHFKGAGFTVDRRLFGQRLLKDAVDSGVTFLDRTWKTGSFTQEGFLVGIVIAARGKSFTNLFGKITVDASGVSAVLRRKLLPELGIDGNIDKENLILCYREIRELNVPLEEPYLIKLYLNQKIAPGGYYWIFPEGNRVVNVGLGVSMKSKYPNPKKQLYDFVLSEPQFAGSKVLDGGVGMVPVRRPLPCMTGNGVAVVGDAAYQVNPINGGGIGPSMLGGMIAGETIIEALEKGDVSSEGLWQYNVRYMKSYGARQAGLDILRNLIQGLSNDDLNFCMKHLVTEEDILKMFMEGELHFSFTQKARKVCAGLKKLTLLKKIHDASVLMKTVKRRYENYPSSSREFEKWELWEMRTWKQKLDLIKSDLQ